MSVLNHWYISLTKKVINWETGVTYCMHYPSMLWMRWMMYFILDLFRKLSMRLSSLLFSTVTARKPVRALVDVRHINIHLPQQIPFSHSDKESERNVVREKLRDHLEYRERPRQNI